jgi:RNA polymerase sigma factor (sigma-70 family)
MMPTEMTDRAHLTAQHDQAAVAAIRDGDAERYRELVERHERRVFAIAWSRLGDAALAEEVTQEAFIRAYRRLWLLGDGAKFSGWVNTIARRLAINFGLRHRRELNKRERWGLEYTAASAGENVDATTDSLPTPETLRQTLAELPDSHRECLVLFYLEGKSGAEAAAALGISESALRVRLHRARTAMRERLEEKLEGSLSRLRPAKALVPAVMAAVLTASSAKAATTGSLGAAVTGALSKFGFLKWLASASLNLFLLPAFALNWLVMRLDWENFRDREGFRARLFRQNTWLIILVMVLFGAAFCFLQPAFKTVDARGMVAPAYTAMSLVAGILLLLSLRMARRLRVIWNRYFASMVATNLMAGCFVLAIGLGWMSITWVGFFILIQAVLQITFYGERPLRTDYNLFLRTAERLLPGAPAAAVIRPEPFPATEAERFRFARFLGKRWLVSNFRQANDILILQLTPVKATFQSLSWNLAYLGFPRNRSRLELRADGTALATLKAADLIILTHICPGGRLEAPALEACVTTAVTLAWQQFRAGDLAAAERALGQVPESEVFIRPIKKSISTQLQRALVIGVAGFVAIHMFYINGLMKSLAISASSPQESSQQEYKRAMNDLGRAKNETQRFEALGDAAKESFVAGKIGESRTYAMELMTLLPKYTSTTTAGDALQDVNLVLGRIAVREGNIAAAKNYLIAAGKSPGSPVMDSFGPNLTLAKDLLEKGERDTVLEYFMLCRKFWKNDCGKLDQWMQEVMAGKNPDFGANLYY